jgi:hypothetical protein
MRACVLFLATVGGLTAAEPVRLTLADFISAGNEGPPPAGWSELPDGTIHLTGKGPGSLISKAGYGNFVLEWEWKISAGGNNGIKYWVTKVAGKEWLGIEYQMIDDRAHADGLRGGSHTTAAVYDIKEPDPAKAYKPAGEWNQSKVVVQDGRIEHWLNGKLAVSADTRSPEWAERIARSKFKNKPGFAPGNGKIMLTEHGDETWIRGLRITGR